MYIFGVVTLSGFAGVPVVVTHSTAWCPQLTGDRTLCDSGLDTRERRNTSKGQKSPQTLLCI